MARPKKSQTAPPPSHGSSAAAAVAGMDGINQAIASMGSDTYHAPAFQYPDYEIYHANATAEQVTIANSPREIEQTWSYHNSRPQAKDSLSNVYSGPLSLPFSGPSNFENVSDGNQLQVLPLPFGSEPPPPDVSPPESSSGISWTSSITDVLSPVHTENIQMQGQYRWTRNPSPLRYPIKPVPAASSGLTLWDKMTAEPFQGNLDPQKESEHRARCTHLLICRWNENGPCQSGGFANREELNWHVKMEHLLECPVLGCIEGSFSGREVLDCHVRWAHKNARQDDPSTTTTAQFGNLETSGSQPLLVSTRPEVEKSPVAAGQAQDRLLKLEMSIGISKRRCREKLRVALERKCRRQNGKLLN